MDLAHDFATGAIGIKDLIEKAEKGPANRIDMLTAVGAFVGLSQQPGWQQRAEEQVQVHQALTTDVLDALAHGGQARAPGGKEWSGHNDKYIYLSGLTANLK